MCREIECHHLPSPSPSAKFHSWAHQVLIGLTIFFFFLSFGVTCHLSVSLSPAEISSGPDHVVLSALEFPLDKFALHCCVRCSCPSSATLCTRLAHFTFTQVKKKQPCKRKTHCRFPSPSVRPFVRPFVGYIWFNHGVVAKYRDERHRYSQFILLPQNPFVRSVVRFNSTKIIIIIMPILVCMCVCVHGERRAECFDDHVDNMCNGQFVQTFSSPINLSDARHCSLCICCARCRNVYITSTLLEATKLWMWQWRWPCVVCTREECSCVVCERANERILTCALLYMSRQSVTRCTVYCIVLVSKRALILIKMSLVPARRLLWWRTPSPCMSIAHVNETVIRLKMTAFSFEDFAAQKKNGFELLHFSGLVSSGVGMNNANALEQVWR